METIRMIIIVIMRVMKSQLKVKNNDNKEDTGTHLHGVWFLQQRNTCWLKPAERVWSICILYHSFTSVCGRVCCGCVRVSVVYVCVSVCVLCVCCMCGVVYVHMCVCAYICVFAWVYIFVFVCMWVFDWVCIHVWGVNFDLFSWYQNCRLEKKQLCILQTRISKRHKPPSNAV